MSLMMVARQQPALYSINESANAEEYVCWTRMQAEAGQSLDTILARKEIERQAGDGVFLWGVGNAPATIASLMARASMPVRAIFSIMKSRPKKIDAAPARVVIWRRYIDAHGIERPIPGHALVTSRGDSPSGAKRYHYALMCRSDEPLVLRRGDRFDPNAFRNAGGKGAPVGSSQVTALLRRVQPTDGPSDYEANLSAWLTGGYWVRLIDPVELDTTKRVLLERLADMSPPDWPNPLTSIFSSPTDPASEATGDRLF
jgi:hypothetical protein